MRFNNSVTQELANRISVVLLFAFTRWYKELIFNVYKVLRRNDSPFICCYDGGLYIWVMKASRANYLQLHFMIYWFRSEKFWVALRLQYRILEKVKTPTSIVPTLNKMSRNILSNFSSNTDVDIMPRKSGYLMGITTINKRILKVSLFPTLPFRVMSKSFTTRSSTNLFHGFSNISHALI